MFELKILSKAYNGNSGESTTSEIDVEPCSEENMKLFHLDDLAND